MTTRSEATTAARPLDRNVRRVLHLTLKRLWFDMIASGQKREEYREIKPYWSRRLPGQDYDAVQFRNGYSAVAPAMMFELLWIDRGQGVLEWGAPDGQEVYILRLGDMLQAPNAKLNRLALERQRKSQSVLKLLLEPACEELWLSFRIYRPIT